MPLEPTFAHEQQFWKEHIQHIAGIDEAGMGALAGPVTAAAVIWDQQFSIFNFQFPNTDTKIRDSKTLSAGQRERAAKWIQEHAIAWAVGEATVEEITSLNIRNAAHLAMQRAIDALAPVPELLLIDGHPAQPHPQIPASNIIKGDSYSLSIAAASILAKVHRDAIMVQLDGQFPAYSFASHKGYGSAFHLAALAEHGPCEHHRPTYAPIRSALTNSRKEGRIS